MWHGRCHRPSSCRPRPAVRTCARGKTLVGRGAVLTCIPLYIVTAPYWIGKGISANIPVSLWIGINSAIYTQSQQYLPFSWIFLAILICQIWWIIFIKIVLKSLENVDLYLELMNSHPLSSGEEILVLQFGISTIILSLPFIA